jgi:hypothetical protein
VHDDRPAGPVTQQLCEELLARTWAVHLVTPSPATDIADPVVAKNVAAAARRISAQLCSSGAELARVRRELAQILWPCFGPPGPTDDWWRTPLGVALTSVETVGVPVRHAGSAPVAPAGRFPGRPPTNAGIAKVARVLATSTSG